MVEGKVRIWDKGEDELGEMKGGWKGRRKGGTYQRERMKWKMEKVEREEKKEEIGRRVRRTRKVESENR